VVRLAPGLGRFALARDSFAVVESRRPNGTCHVGPRS
jgi:hypothetical protein